MPRVCWVGLLPLAGCSSILGLGDPAALPPDAPAASCTIAGFDLCAHQQPNGPIHFGSDATINTTLDCNVVLFTPDGGSVCVIYATEMSIDATLSGYGSRPLVLAATGTITVTGAVDVSSVYGRGGPASNPPACAAPIMAGDTGGGPGGSFHGKGGNGGNGTTGASTGGGQAADAVPLPTFLRGGCDGSGHQLDGGAGNGGGAVQLAAGQAIEIASTGRVLSGGGGGTGAFGASGGGSGGMIVLGAPSIHIAGVVAANGGGGGEGPDMNGSGKPGEPGQPSAVAAKGGSGGAAQGGDGGDGSASTTLAGANGKNAGTSAAGGGGGGGAGYIVIDSQALDATGGTISPPQS